MRNFNPQDPDWVGAREGVLHPPGECWACDEHRRYNPSYSDLDQLDEEHDLYGNHPEDF